LCFGIFWITREEGVWVLPGFAAIILYFLFKNYKHRDRFRLIIKSLTLYTLAALVIPLSTAYVNYFKYGSFQTVDVKSSSFVNALNALNNVDIGEEVQYLPVSQKKREAIYKVSPSFKELESYFEGAGKDWAKPGCSIYKHTCGDYAGGWFMWALRDGVASLGYYKNPIRVAEYYERLAKEIHSACNKGALKCIKNPIPFIPRITKEAIQSIPGKIIEAISLTIYKKQVPLTAGPSWGPISKMETIQDFLGNPRIVPPYQSKLQVAGWFYASQEKWISLNCYDNNSKKNISIVREASPDIAKHFNDAKAKYQRFSFVLNDFENCSLSFSNSEIKEIQLNNLLKAQNKNLKYADGHIYFDYFQVANLKQVKWLNFKQLMIDLYSSISLYLFVIGSLSTVLSLLTVIYLRRNATDLMIIAACLWVLYYSRIAIVVMVDVTSFPGINHLYLLPAFPLWTAASIVGIATFISLIMSIKNISHAQDLMAEKKLLENNK
jgi:hypothetical protein